MATRVGMPGGFIRILKNYEVGIQRAMNTLDWYLARVIAV